MRLIESFVNLIAPLHCVRCDTEGSVICEPCLNAELINIPSCCFSCARITNNFMTCALCSKHSALKAVWCVADYNNLARSIITTYKYDAVREVRKIIVQEMLKVLPSTEFLITNIPTATDRIRQRGFDHCALIAREIAKERHLPYSALLYRTNSSHQVGSSKSERLKQTENLFQIKNKFNLKEKTILLIDDVATTGATMQSAARILKNSGAKDVYGLVFAKKL